MKLLRENQVVAMTVVGAVNSALNAVRIPNLQWLDDDCTEARENAMMLGISRS